LAGDHFDFNPSIIIGQNLLMGWFGDLRGDIEFEIDFISE
jgi:hypothetical protein